MGRLAIFRWAMACSIAAPALAQPVSAAVQPQPAAIRITAGPAPAAFAELSRRTGLNILYAPGTVDGVRTRAVDARVSPEQALRLMLRDTPLYVEANPSGSMLVRRRAAAPRPAAVPTRPAAGRSAPALEADPPAVVEAAAGLQDIIVTAQRRSESFQRAAVALDVISADQVAKSLITSPTQLGTLVPSLQSANGAGTQPTFYIRGVGTFATNPITDAAVAFNYDGVYIARLNATTGYFFDLARIEVLKGPQGTLYGRNATGGAINVIPQTPKLDESAGFFSAALGNYDTVNLQGAVNLVTSANSALRLSGTYARHDGFQRDGTSDLDGRAVRAQFLIEPTPDLRIRLSGDYAERFGRGNSGTITHGVNINPFTNTLTITPTGFSTDVGPGDPLTARFFEATFSGQAGRTLEQFDIQPALNGRFYGALAQIDWTTPIGVLTVLPAYRHGRLDDLWNPGSFPIQDIERTHQTSVEARLAGKLGPFDYLIGAYYFDESVRADFTAFNQTLTAYQVYKTATKSYAGFGRLTYHASDRLRLVAGARYTQDKKAIDGVSNVFLDICNTGFCPGAPLLPYTATAEGLIAQLGLIPVAPGVFIQPGNPAAADTIFVLAVTTQNGRLKNRRPTYRGAIEFDVAPSSLLYASFESGFRAGGFSFSSTYPSYEPETINAWTIGSKSRFFDNRLQLNLEAYYWKYNNQQFPHQGIEANGQPNFFTQNIGKSTNKGFEIDMQYLLTRNTLLALDVQYLDAKYNSFLFQLPATINPVLGTAGAPVYLPPVTSCPSAGPVGGQYTIDCSGRRALSSPKWTITIGAQQTIPIDDNKLVLAIDTHYQTATFVGFEMLPEQRQGAYWRTNASMTFYTRNEQLSLGAFVNNIENKRRLQVSGYTEPVQAINGLYSDPRTYGLRMDVRF